MLSQLFKQDRLTVATVLEKSLFMPDKTVDALRELLRAKVIRKQAGQLSSHGLALGEAVSSKEKKIDVAALMADQEYELKEKSGPESDSARSERREGPSPAQVKKVTDEYLLHCLGNLVLFLLLSLPWFLWTDLFEAFAG